MRFRSVLPILIVLGLAGPAAAAPAAFTREAALAQARAVDPEAALPADELPAGVSAREDVAYATMGGIELRLDLYRPSGDGPFPVVLVVHGGGWDSGDRTMERPFAKRLAAAGLVTASVSYRLGPAGRFPLALHDLKAAVRWLRAHAGELGIDPEAIGVVGGSAGGQLAAMLGATNEIARFEGDGPHRDVSSTVQAVVDIDGLADFTGPALVEQQRARPSAPTRFLGVSVDDDPQAWRDASPVTHVGLRSAPTLFITSTAPTPLLPGREEMSRRLTMMGIGSQILTMEDSPHVFWLVEPWFTPTVDETAKFFRRYLIGGDEP